MNIDYKAIGKRIRIARIKANMKQEQIAEIVKLSPTHISNIETGNTKLSLPTIINIANTLSTSVDELLCDNVLYSKKIFQKEIENLTNDCDNYEIRILTEVLISVKNALRHNLEFHNKLNTQ